MQYSIVNFKGLQKNLRMDAEFYKPKYLKYEKIIENISNDFLFNLANNKYETFNNKSGFFEYIEISNINLSTGEYQTEIIESYFAPSRAKKRVKQDDVLISTVRPNRNAVSIILENKSDLVASTGFCKLTAENINPNFLFILFKTSIYREFLERYTTATMYPAVSEDDIMNLKIPLFSNNFQLLTENLVNGIKNNLFKSKSFYQQSQNILLSELGLLDWKPKHKLSFVKNFSDTKVVGRIDAEYFQPKYNEIVDAIKRYDGGWDTLANLVSLKKCIEVGASEYLEEGIPFIRVSNISAFEITKEKYISEKLYNEIKQHQPEKGEILLSKDATPGIAYYLNKSPEKMIPSGGILRLKLKNDRINGEYLTLVLNSVIMQQQIKRDVGGSVIVHWRPDQVEKTFIPILKNELQEEIRNKVSESFNLRHKSKALLEISKRGVEIAIEQDEQTAEKWMKQQVADLGVTL